MTLQIHFARLFIVLLSLIIQSQAVALSSGIAGYSGRDSASTCISSGCHSGGQIPQVTLEGPESVTAGTQTTLFLRVSGGQQNLVGYGVSLPVNGGFDEQTHSSPLSAGTAVQVIEITWNVPSVAGTYTIYAAGLSANGNSGPDGDNAAFATLAIEVTPTAGIQRPAVMISLPAAAAPGEQITIDGSGTVPPDMSKTLSRFLWDFGDGSTAQSSDTSPSINYT
jgi:hypothetical protein